MSTGQNCLLCKDMDWSPHVRSEPTVLSVTQVTSCSTSKGDRLILHRLPLIEQRRPSGEPRPMFGPCDPISPMWPKMGMLPFEGPLSWNLIVGRQQNGRAGSTCQTPWRVPVRGRWSKPCQAPCASVPGFLVQLGCKGAYFGRCPMFRTPNGAFGAFSAPVWAFPSFSARPK